MAVQYGLASQWKHRAEEREVAARRMARIDRRVASTWLSKASQKSRSERRCGYQWPYRAEKRAVVTGSLTGVQSSIQG